MHEQFMRMALKQAQLAYDDGEIPIGAVIVYEGKVIAKAHNQTQRLKDPTAHAEMIAITAACGFLGAKYLPDCTIYVTLEPCVMCAGAIKWAQLSTIVFGAPDPKVGYQLMTKENIFPAKYQIISGVLEDECRKIILSFFEEIRMRN